MEITVAENPNLGPLFDEGVKPLPDWKKMEKPFEAIALLSLDKDEKNAIVLWWKENPRVLDKLAELQQVSTSINLPKNEAVEVVKVYKDSLTLLKATNDSLIDFIEGDGEKKLMNKVMDLYASAFGRSRGDKKARIVNEAVNNFGGREEGMELTTAVAKAIIETRSQNPDDNMFRKKTAQQVFQEMFDQLAIARIIAINDVDAETSEIIDSPKSEKIELTSAFMAETWTGDERKKMLRNFNKLRRVLNKLEADTDEKIGLNTLWRWANGKIPKDSSVFKVLQHADALNREITDTVADAWQAEADRKEDEEELED